MKRSATHSLLILLPILISIPAFGQVKPAKPPHNVAGPSLGAVGPSGGHLFLPTVNVLTQHNDIARTGANLQETILNPANVNVNTFGKLFQAPVDGFIYAQPLYVSNLIIAGARHNVLYIATENNSVFALDADSGVQLWQSPSLGPPVSTSILNDTNIQGGVVGITATPVIDLGTNTIYVEARSLESGTYIHRLHALDLISGAEKFNGPVVITATASGTGYDNVGGVVTFNPQTAHSRPGLLLLNGVVYMAFASLDDLDPYHGWIIGYQASDISTQLYSLCITPNGSQGGIWQSGTGLVSDGSSIYAVVGNGTATVQTGGADYGECFLKLSPSLALQSYFLTHDFAGLNTLDDDNGSGGPVFIPSANMFAGGGKAGAFYLTKPSGLGGYALSTNNNVQTLGGLGQLFSGPVSWNSNNGEFVYIWGAGATLSMNQLSGGKFILPPYAHSSFSSPGGYSTGASMALSANGGNSNSGILWAALPIADGTNNVIGGTLYALNAANPTQILWSSIMNAARDDLGNWAKFAAPTVVNGHVYLATDNNYVYGYGLLSEQKAPLAPTGLTALPASAQVILNWSTVTGAAAYNVYRGASPGGEGAVPIATGLTSPTYVDSTVTNGVTYYYTVAGVSIGGVGQSSNEASATPLASLNGYISASLAPNSATPIDLTATGGLDWAHWGYSQADKYDHKATGGGKISNYTVSSVHGVALTPPPATNIGFSWTDGTTTPNATNSLTGLYVPGAGSSLSIAVPADNVTTHTVQVYLFGYSGVVGVTAHLSDNSYVDWTGTVPQISGVSNQLLTLTYRSGSPGQTLTITLTAVSVMVGNGGVGLESATLN